MLHVVALLLAAAPAAPEEPLISPNETQKMVLKDAKLYAKHDPKGVVYQRYFRVTTPRVKRIQFLTTFCGHLNKLSTAKAISWPTLVTDDGLFVPGDATLRVLVFMDAPQRVPELMQHHGIIEPPQVHRGLRLGDAKVVSAHVGVCTLRRDVGYAQVALCRCHPPLKRYVDVLTPSVSSARSKLVLLACATQKSYLQCATVLPLLRRYHSDTGRQNHTGTHRAGQPRYAVGRIFLPCQFCEPVQIIGRREYVDALSHF